MTDQMLNLSYSMKEIFELIPGIASETLKHSSMASDIAAMYKGAEFSFVFEFDGEKYHLVIKDGTDFKTGLGDLEKPMFRIAMTMSDLEKLLDLKNAQMFLRGREGMGELPMPGKDKLGSLHSVLSSVSGTMIMELTHEDDTTSSFQVTFNDSPASSLTVKMTMADARDLATGESNPVSLFMGGRIQIDGDIGIAMSLQSLLM